MAVNLRPQTTRLSVNNTYILCAYILCVLVNVYSCLVAGLVAGGLVIFCLIVIGGYWFMSRRDKGETKVCSLLCACSCVIVFVYADFVCLQSKRDMEMSQRAPQHEPNNTTTRNSPLSDVIR